MDWVLEGAHRLHQDEHLECESPRAGMAELYAQTDEVQPWWPQRRTPTLRPDATGPSESRPPRTAQTSAACPVPGDAAAVSANASLARRDCRRPEMSPSPGSRGAVEGRRDSRQPPSWQQGLRSPRPPSLPSRHPSSARSGRRGPRWPWERPGRDWLSRWSTQRQRVPFLC